MDIKLSFNEGAVYFVLAAFNKVVRADGFIYDKDTHEKVLSNDGIPIQLAKFGGIIMRDKKPVFLINDLYTIMLLAENRL